MNNPLQRCTITYIVRVWGEYLNQQPPVWRGVVEMPDRTEEIPFTSLEEMKMLIEKHIILQIGLEENP